MYVSNQFKSFGIGIYTTSPFDTDYCHHSTQCIREHTIKSKYQIYTKYSEISKSKIQQNSFIQIRYFSRCIAVNRSNPSTLDSRDIHGSEVTVLNILKAMYIEISAKRICQFHRIQNHHHPIFICLMRTSVNSNIRKSGDGLIISGASISLLFSSFQCRRSNAVWCKPLLKFSKVQMAKQSG